MTDIPGYEGGHTESLYETVPEADYRSLFHERVSSPEIRAVFGSEKLGEDPAEKEREKDSAVEKLQVFFRG